MDVSSVLEQHLHDIGVTMDRSPMKSRFTILISDIHISSSIQQQTNGLRMSIPSGPVQGGDAGLEGYFK